MSPERYRLDLDGVDLRDRRGRVVCIVRLRTRQGLVLRLPESTDVTVPWSLVQEARLDLMHGRVLVRFTPQAVSALSWLQAETELTGEWTDRCDFDGVPR